jgi:hypothetical protein
VLVGGCLRAAVARPSLLARATHGDFLRRAIPREKVTVRFVCAADRVLEFQPGVGTEVASGRRGAQRATPARPSSKERRYPYSRVGARDCLILGPFGSTNPTRDESGGQLEVTK